MSDRKQPTPPPDDQTRPDPPPVPSPKLPDAFRPLPVQPLYPIISMTEKLLMEILEEIKALRQSVDDLYEQQERKL